MCAPLFQAAPRRFGSRNVMSPKRGAGAGLGVERVVGIPLIENKTKVKCSVPLIEIRNTFEVLKLL